MYNGKFERIVTQEEKKIQRQKCWEFEILYQDKSKSNKLHKMLKDNGNF